MIKIVQIGSESQIEEFNIIASKLNQKQISHWLNYQDPTTIEYLYEPYLQYEVKKIEDSGSKLFQVFDATHLLVTI